MSVVSALQKRQNNILDKRTTLLFQFDCYFPGIVKHNLNLRLKHLKVGSTSTVVYLTKQFKTKLKLVGLNSKTLKN